MLNHAKPSPGGVEICCRNVGKFPRFTNIDGWWVIVQASMFQYVVLRTNNFPECQSYVFNTLWQIIIVVRFCEICHEWIWMGTVYSICILLGCASQLQIGSNYPIYNSQPVISYVPGSKYSLVSQKKRRFSLINEVAVLFTTLKESPMKGCMTILLH
jgi:hypothetical protein